MSNTAAMTANEKIIGIETMRARIEAFHVDRLERIGFPEKIEYFRTAKWSRAKVLKEFRELNEEVTPGRAVDFEIPISKSDAEMAHLIKLSGAALIG